MTTSCQNTQTEQSIFRSVSVQCDQLVTVDASSQCGGVDNVASAPIQCALLLTSQSTQADIVDTRDEKSMKSTLSLW